VHEAGSWRADDGTCSDSAAAGAGSTLDGELDRSKKPSDQENTCMPCRKAIKALERENGRAKKLKWAVLSWISVHGKRSRRKASYLCEEEHALQASERARTAAK
jgi:hypothetical protein